MKNHTLGTPLVITRIIIRNSINNSTIWKCFSKTTKKNFFQTYQIVKIIDPCKELINENKKNFIIVAKENSFRILNNVI